VAYTVTLWVNGSSSSLYATITNGSSSVAALGSGHVVLQPLDLITIQITYPIGGALSSGACITLIVSADD
jgi:hypothetical protein